MTRRSQGGRADAQDIAAEIIRRAAGNDDNGSCGRAASLVPPCRFAIWRESSADLLGEDMNFRLVITLGMTAAVLAVQTVRAQEGARPDKVSFYFVAHEDDWQLFMNPSAFEDVANSGTSAVFIHTTAGDAGLGTGANGRRFPYYRARENGAETAIRFMADAQDMPAEKTLARLNFNEHEIERASYGNTVTYFLRLPDGSPTGEGFEGTGYQSLQRLASGDIASIAAVDGSAVYRGWTDLVSTVRAIVQFERGQASALQLNVSELDARLNPKDHSDHLMTARAALQAAAGITCASRYHYVDYASAKLAANLNAQQREMESSVVAVTAAGIAAMDHGSIWKPYYRSYLGRSYFRVEPGEGRCDAAPAQLSVAASQR
jgi:hypothetical protein